MEIVRAVRLDDLDPLLELTGKATYGLTTLQLDRARLLERVERSVFAFTRLSQSPAGEPYVLVMEDTTTGQLVGTSTLYAKTGGFEPFYAYRIEAEWHQSSDVNQVGTQHRALHLERIYDGPSEIGSLFLLRAFRGHGRGRLLSLARFAVLAQRPHRFSDRVIAEMRGRCDAEGVSPFWEAVMRPFFGIDFSVADAMSTVSKAFIEDLMPRYPLYLDLLPPAAREVIGDVHDETQPAVRLLESEGFAATDLIDIFDAGPVLQCPVDQIDAVRRCQPAQVVIGAVDTALPQQMLCSMVGGFRALLAPANVGGEMVMVTAEVAHRLGVEAGQTVWVMNPHC